MASQWKNKDVSLALRYAQLIDEETDYHRALIYSAIGWAGVYIISTRYIENVPLV
jgi:hypothetical protein